MRNQNYIQKALDNDFGFIDVAKKEIEGLIKGYEKMSLDELTELHNTLNKCLSDYKIILKDVEAKTIQSMYDNYANILANDIKQFVSNLLDDDSVEVKVDVYSTMIDFQFSQENEKFCGGFNVYIDRYAKSGVNVIRQYNYSTMGFNPFEQNSKYLVHRFAGLGYLATQVKPNSVLVSAANGIVLQERTIRKTILNPIDKFCQFVRGRKEDIEKYIQTRKKRIFFGGLTIGQKIVWGYNIGVVTKINRKTVEISNWKEKKRVKKDELYARYNLKATEIANNLKVGMSFVKNYDNDHKIVITGELDLNVGNNIKVTECYKPYFDNSNSERNILNILTDFTLQEK